MDGSYHAFLPRTSDEHLHPMMPNHAQQPSPAIWPLVVCSRQKATGKDPTGCSKKPQTQGAPPQGFAPCSFPSKPTAGVPLLT